MQIVLSDVSKSYHDASKELTVLQNVSATFEDGHSVAIVGRSGVGKSTLLNLLSGLDHVSSGTIMIGEERISSLKGEELTSFRGKNIGFVFQFHQLLSDFSAKENVELPLLIAGVSPTIAGREARIALERVGLQERLGHRPGELSGGEQQRTALARALVHRPRVVLADEPTGNLDVSTAREVLNLIETLRAEEGFTLVVVTHSKDLAFEMDSQYEMLPGGRLEPINSR